METKTLWTVVGVVVLYLLIAYNKKWFPFDTEVPTTPPANPPAENPSATGRYGAETVSTLPDGRTTCTVYNPNGTVRIFTGLLSDPGFAALCQYAQSQSIQPYYYYTYPIYTRFWRFGRRGHHGGGGPGVGGPGGPGSGTGGGTGGGTPGSGTGGGAN